MAILRKKPGHAAQDKTGGERTSERKAAVVSRENLLLQQIDEFKNKAEQLQEMLEEKEEEAAELEKLVKERDSEAKQLEALVTARREEADQLIVGVTIQIQEMIQELDQQMSDLDLSVRRLLNEFSGKLEEELAESETRTQAQVTALNETIGKRMDQLDAEIGDRLAKVDASTEAQVKDTGAKIDEKLSGLTDAVEETLGGLTGAVDGKLGTLNETVDGRLGTLNETIDSRVEALQGQLDEQLTGFGDRIDGQLTSLNESLTGQIEDSLTRTREQAQQIQTLVDGLKEDQETMKKDLFEKIHSEDVKCYRNVKDLLDQQSAEISEQLEKVKLSEESLTSIRKSFKGLKVMAFFAIVDLAAIVAGFLMIFMGL